ncbi:MAG: amino acid permease [Chloroflexi bacterium]|nr:amino acid permease [Chloroflexota bacterium]
MPDAPVALRRSLGLVEVTAGGVGIIIGAGVYVLVGTATAEAGAAVWLAFLVAALLSVLTALSYMELVSMFPTAAGEYEYTRHAFPDWVAFTAGWSMTVTLIVASAAVALGFAHYLGYFVSIDIRIGALALLALVSAIAVIGIEQSARLALVLSAVQITGLLIVTAIGVRYVGNVNLIEQASPSGVLGGAALVFFAFIGFDEVITLAEETEDPTRTVPRALLLALGISTLLYVGVAVSAVSVLGVEALASSNTPLADVAHRAFGERSGQVIAGLAMLTTMNTTLLAVTASSRLLYGMASRGSLPRFLASIDQGRRTPMRAILFSAVLSGGFVALRDLRLVASVTDFAMYVVFLLVNATVVVLRFTEPDRIRPFRIPGNLGVVPLTPLIGVGTILLMLTELEPGAMALGMLLVGAGLIVLVGLRWAGVKGAPHSLAADK